MKKSKNKKKSLLLILLLLVVGISIGYAALATTLNINGNTTIEKASWDIHFENLVKTTGSEVATVEASIDNTKTLIEYTVTLPKPGDFYEFTVDMVNNGTIDAMISEVLKEGLTTDQEKYIEYAATYSDGVVLEEKDYLKSGETQNVKVRVKYRDDINATDLPTEETTLNLKFQVTYIQADETAKEIAQLGFVPTYFAFGTPTSESTKDYTTLGINVFAGLGTDNLLGVCINDGGLFCIKNNDYENSLANLKKYFEEEYCDLGETYIYCESESFSCGANSNGEVNCNTDFRDAGCVVDSNNKVQCN